MRVKHCNRCDTDYPLSSFNRNCNNPDGLHSQCKSCHLESTKLSQARRKQREGENLLKQGEAHVRTVARKINSHWKIADLSHIPQLQRWKL